MNKYFFNKYLIKNVFLLSYVIILDFFFYIFFYFRRQFILKDPKNIIICNLGHIGDVLYTLTLVENIKQKYPNAEIDFLCGSYSSELVKKNKLIKNIVIIDHWLLNRDQKNIFIKIYQYIYSLYLFFKKIKYRHYDLCINFFPFYPNPVLFLKFLGTKFIISFNSSGFNFLNDSSTLWKLKKQHTLLYNYELLSLLGIKNKNPLNIKNNFLSYKKNLDHKSKTVCIHPCSLSIIKEWDINKWIDVINFLNKNNFICLITGNGNREEEYAQNLLKMISDKNKTFNYSNKLSFEEYCGVINSSSFVVTVDTLTVHIANLFKKETIVIRPGITLDQHWMPITKRSSVLRYNTDCYPCLNSNGCQNMKCIKKISAYNVINKIRIFLNT